MVPSVRIHRIAIYGILVLFALFVDGLESLYE